MENINRRIIIGLVTSKKYCRLISSIYKPEYMEDEITKILINWCLNFYDLYNKNPSINCLKNRIKEEKNNISNDNFEFIELFLNSLDGTDTENIEVLINDTCNYFEKINIKKNIELVSFHLESGNLKEAKKVKNSYKEISKEELKEFDPYFDREKIKETLEYTVQPLIKFPGIFGSFINNQLCKDSFVAFLAPEKRGKSFWLVELAYQGYIQGRNVAFFQCGDLSERQQHLRFLTRLTEKIIGEEKTILVPVLDCLKNQNGICPKMKNNMINWDIELQTIDDLQELFEEYKEHIICSNLTCNNFEGAFWYHYRKLNSLTIDNFRIPGNRENKIKISCHPSRILRVKDIEFYLDEWKERDNFVPEIIVIDYADLLRAETRDKLRLQQDEIWKDLRGLSLKNNCCLITATQANAESYNKKRLNLSNFSESKNKYAHVTAFFGINQTEEEKIKGVQRISKLLLRNDLFNIREEMCILQSLSLGQIFRGAFKKIIEDED